MAENLADRTGTETMTLVDRRRLAMTYLYMEAEKAGGMVTPLVFGKAVNLNTTATEDNTEDVYDLSDSLSERLHKLRSTGR